MRIMSNTSTEMTNVTITESLKSKIPETVWKKYEEFHESLIALNN